MTFTPDDSPWARAAAYQGKDDNESVPAPSVLPIRSIDDRLKQDWPAPPSEGRFMESLVMLSA